jgi:glycosyltransferase involved in cell wall biosynthesis
MRILFLSNLYPPEVMGGYELACSNIAHAMSKRGHEVRVLTTWCHLPRQQPEPEWVERRLDLHWYIPHKSSNATVDQRDLHSAVCSSYANTLHLMDRLRDFRPDVVYVWNLIGIGAAAMLDLLNQVQVPWALHLMDRTPVEIVNNVPTAVLGLFNAQGSELYASALILAMSQNLLEEIEALGGIRFAQGAELVPGWADGTAALPHEPYLRDGTARFVAAGNVAPWKGIDLILDACGKLHSEGLPVTVDVFGDGELLRYSDMARAMHLENCFRLLGPRSQPELMRLYAGYDAFLFPTWEREPFGFAPVEAAACGTPPIMTRTCGAAERFVDGVHCVKIERTVEELTSAMRRVATGELDVARIGRASRRLAATDLSLARCVDRIEALLQGHAQPWRNERLNDPFLPLHAFLKHNLSVSLRFG